MARKPRNSSDTRNELLLQQMQKGVAEVYNYQTRVTGRFGIEMAIIDPVTFPLARELFQGAAIFAADTDPTAIKIIPIRPETTDNILRDICRITRPVRPPLKFGKEISVIVFANNRIDAFKLNLRVALMAEDDPNFEYNYII